MRDFLTSGIPLMIGGWLLFMAALCLSYSSRWWGMEERRRPARGSWLRWGRQQ